MYIDGTEIKRSLGENRIESVEEIRDELTGALLHIDRDQLIAASDCSLAMLRRELATKKLKNLCDAAGSI